MKKAECGSFSVYCFLLPSPQKGPRCLHSRWKQKAFLQSAVNQNWLFKHTFHTPSPPPSPALQHSTQGSAWPSPTFPSGFTTQFFTSCSASGRLVTKHTLDISTSGSLLQLFPLPSPLFPSSRYPLSHLSSLCSNLNLLIQATYPSVPRNPKPPTLCYFFFSIALTTF